MCELINCPSYDLEAITYSELFELIKYIFLSFTGVVGSIVAWKGLNTWQRQISGQHKYETAMKLLRCLIQVRTDIKSIRSPVNYISEIYEAFKEIEGRIPINSDELYKKDYLRIVKGKRLNKALNDLYAALIDVEIVFDSLVILEVDKIFEFITKLNKEIELIEYFKGEAHLGTNFPGNISTDVYILMGRMIHMGKR
ncbi:hypothetical protein [Leptospira kirschneri]|uniref:hypothetical protein n=1 Tax=Leptospira kirschneri TaxID=29507 RepID=UPI0002BD5EA9|nr:hypothetical protein [Leptospira kirschneri]EMN25352.1 hypothetical protein LEP1GSC065_2296 [Leptospira kirschneri serovar Sokoine str. RM1]